MKGNLRLAGVALAVSFLSGCTSFGNLGTVFRDFDLDGGRSVSVDAQQRAILVNKTVDERGVQRTIYCAEPSPDSLFAIGAALGGSGSLKTPTGHEGELSIAHVVASAASDALSTRNATIQLLRDGLYRACEAHASGALSKLEYAEVTGRYQKMMLALLTVELVSNLNRPRREVSVLANDAKVDAAKAGAAPQEGSGAGEIAKLKGGSEASAIAAAHGRPANATALQGQMFYSDNAIKIIADTAEGLVARVLHSEDRVGQCLRYMAYVSEQRNIATQLALKATETMPAFQSPGADMRQSARISHIEDLCAALIERSLRPGAAEAR